MAFANQNQWYEFDNSFRSLAEAVLPARLSGFS